MQNIQNDQLYMSCLKTLNNSIGKILKIYSHPNLSVDSLQYFQRDLAKWYPDVENLALELNEHYDAGIVLSENDFDSDIEKVEALKGLNRQISEALADNPSFKDVGLMLNLKNPSLLEELVEIKEYFLSFEEDEAEKGIYWTSRIIEVSQDVVYGAHLKNEESISRNLDDSQAMNNLLVSFFGKENTEEMDSSMRKVESSIFNALADVYEQLVVEDKADFQDVIQSFRKVLLEKYGVDWFENDKVLNENKAELMEILDGCRRKYSELCAIEDKLYDAEERIAALEPESMREIITKNSLDAFDVSFEQEDLAEILTTYPEFQPIQQEADEKYADYNDWASVYDSYENEKIEDRDLYAYFRAQMKQWINITVQNAIPVQEALDSFEEDTTFPYYGYDDIEEFKADILAKAEDVVLIGNLAPSLFVSQTKDGEQTAVELNTSGIGMKYVQKLMYDNSRMTMADFQNINMLFNSFLSEYEYNKKRLKHKNNEQTIASGLKDEEYIAALGTQDESLAKHDMILYSRHAFEAIFEEENKKLQDVGEKIFEKGSGIHQNATKNFESWLQLGVEAYPNMTPQSIEKDSLMYNKILTCMTIPVVYQKKMPRQDEVDEMIECAVSRNNYDEKEKGLLKFAIEKYRNEILQIHVDLVQEGKEDAELKKLGKKYLKTARSWSHATANIVEIGQLYDEASVRQQEYALFKEYEKKTIPDKEGSLEYALFLNSRRGR